LEGVSLEPDEPLDLSVDLEDEDGTASGVLSDEPLDERRPTLPELVLFWSES
jgi:hypothetical protein